MSIDWQSKTKRMTTRKPLDVDQAIARKIENLRCEAGVTLEKMAAQLDLSWQQMYKYCQGKTRISCGRLEQIARIFNTPVSYFFDETETHVEQPTKTKRALLELTRAFGALKTHDARLAIVAVVKAMAGEEKEQAAIDKRDADNLMNCTTQTHIENHD